jgi:hypothetical protein
LWEKNTLNGDSADKFKQTGLAARQNASVCMNNSQHCGSYVISLTATLPVQQIKVQQIISTRLHWTKCLIHNNNLSLSRTIP